MANARVSPTQQYDGAATSKLYAGSSSALNGQPSSGYSSLGNDDPDTAGPKFKGNVEKWKCPICHRVVRNPVQTVCGHRYCESCLTDHLPKDGTAIKCPANEEDCEMISKEDHTVSSSSKKSLQWNIQVTNKTFLSGYSLF